MTGNMEASRRDRLYVIVNQEQMRSPRQNAAMGYDWQITIQTPSGVERTFTLPDEQYNAKNVHDVAQALAQEVEEVANLPDSLGAQATLPTR